MFKNPLWAQIVFWLGIAQDDADLLDAIIEKYKGKGINFKNAIPVDMRTQLEIGKGLTIFNSSKQIAAFTPLNFARNQGMKNAEKWLIDHAHFD